MNGTAFPLSGVSYGQQLQFHGIAQRSHFPAYVAPNYVQVFADAREAHPYQTCIAMFDAAVPGATRFLGELETASGTQLIRIPLEAGERLKTLDKVSEIATKLGEHHVSEKSLMLVIGGGTLCNAAGFIAAMWNGMEQIVIPTNFTAIGDVAIGSLHMVNLGSHKNSLQLYADPLAVVLDPRFIPTLPVAERRSGLAETAKHAIAQDSALFDHIERQIAAGVLFEDDAIFDLALRTAQLKDAYMASDPSGPLTQHTFLYGHVIAHAIEPASDYAIPHGEAVSLGLLVELAFFHEPTAPIFVRVKKMLEAIGLPTRLPPQLNACKITAQLAHAMTLDGKLSIPRVEEIGSLRMVGGKYTADFDRSAVNKALGVIAT